MTQHSPAPGLPADVATPPPAGLPADANETWHLLYRGWVLSTPRGVRISLTALERVCFLAIAEHPGRELSRDALLKALPGASLRTLNVAISRLRKKVGEAGAELPLHTVHGMGYVFLGHLMVQPS
ncbi:helix-turn-helix domain-containing protein [Bordetella pseudohinzii]|uniref:Dye resistance protein n=1 Tax=Bordetella pseudohinzii TaxID=1331258 RepID=A0A0J6C4E1_9BORD|nr:helix-turn-helix domain-containing protein [Bordetella pseudohinzii]ANY17030.1 transcriptional regulator [Bordetella pseudohinzii]KMM24142.1 transcriptional regulator [Bordetella pseudohinzii]KXA78339.1 transcriptional regulator [Bordetella pseudohinzii]KXA78388.1 transcriptional regulator [Bordetella pseudohinzii]CUJ12281.1 Dye resistance protein [Bordetella pseudohinzii]